MLEGGVTINRRPTGGWAGWCSMPQSNCGVGRWIVLLPERGYRMADFSIISGKYEKDSIVQRSASEILLELSGINQAEDVLDLGCGTGHVTKLIKEKTSGRVVGIDPAAGMIEQAAKHADERTTFRLLAADQLDYLDEFDVIFCNSAFQWFLPPHAVLQKCYNGLKPGGRMSMQAPAREIYSPNFLAAIDAVRTDPSTRETFTHFTSPWFFLETAAHYQALFEGAGFSVKHAALDKVSSSHSAAELFKIFESGASAGYLNERNYSCKLPQDYADRFRTIVSDVFESQADPTGMVELIFYRIYLLGIKEATRYA